MWSPTKLERGETVSTLMKRPSFFLIVIVTYHSAPVNPILLFSGYGKALLFTLCHKTLSESYQNAIGIHHQPGMNPVLGSIHGTLL
jgi:hypothetical protein